MFIVHVHVHVKPESVEAFKAASLENACNSVQEPGIARFDVIQQRDDPTRFVLVEVYRTPEDPAKEILRCDARMSTLSPIILIIFAVCFTSLGFDLIMALEPDWFSTLFGTSHSSSSFEDCLICSSSHFSFW